MVLIMRLFLPLYEFSAGAIGLCLTWVINHFNLFTQYQNNCLLLSIILIIIALLSACLLIRKRGFKNYCKSLSDTTSLRSFLYQQKNINDFTDKTKIDINQNIYNTALHYTYIDYFPDHVDIWICIPKNVTAKAVLDKNLKNAEEEISSYTNGYIISPRKRKGGYYYYHGERK